MAESMGPEDLHIIHLEQRVEVMAAMAEENDLNFAFQLQMHEAMTASRALQPSSSRPPSPDYSIIAALTAGDGNDVLGMTTALMLQDMDRFTQECEDQRRCKDEIKRTKEDLDRRIHDQKLAQDILNVPEDEWKRSGDNYERPYGVVASSSETECLRLYCKGLVSEERIRDVNSLVAGAGIAICDSRNNLIFEAKKNLEVVDGDKVLGSDAAELEALIEGLNYALALDLNRFTFFCDDYLVYQYVKLLTLLPILIITFEFRLISISNLLLILYLKTVYLTLVHICFECIRQNRVLRRIGLKWRGRSSSVKFRY